ncbi:MAG: dihydroneopterin triphosphate diphosphatase [Betaproteobacteria bacterium]|nr:dihydroneopterin triphosphate diphosphatase [Betaproteobacteria bacterium]
MTLKLPLSVLVVIHTPALEILLLERAARPGFWQSVTGSLAAPEEPLQQAARREVCEETGIQAGVGCLRRWPLTYTFEVYPEWRHRFVPGTVHNTEHVFSLELPLPQPVALAPGEHLASRWLPWPEAAAQCFSWSNRDAIRMLASRA